MSNNEDSVDSGDIQLELNDHYNQVLKIMKHIKDIKEAKGIIDDAIVEDMQNVNNIGDFYIAANSFITVLNDTKNINTQLNDIFNKSNSTKLSELDRDIIESFNGVNPTINDEFYNDVKNFIGELNNKNDINDINEKLNGIFNETNMTKLTELDNEIIKSFNIVNTTINDEFYSE